MKSLTMQRAWGRFKQGAIVAILQPGDPLSNGAVDPGRAAQLVADGLAEATPEPEPTEEQDAPERSAAAAAPTTMKGSRRKKSAKAKGA